MIDHDVNITGFIYDKNDTGDETASRYRYQWIYAAIMCCMLLDDTQHVTEVYCEKLEDVLLKYDDDTFSGLQVKTRASNQEPWKTSDEDVIKSFARFSSLDNQYPRRFREFRFLTNHPLYSARNGQDILYMLQEIRKSDNLSSINSGAKRFLKQVAKEAECTEEMAYITLKKTAASHALPKLTDGVVRLISTLTTIWPRAVECSYQVVNRAAIALIEECGRASSLAHTDTLPAFIAAVINPEDAELTARLSGKMINKVRILDVLERGLDETIPLYCDPNKLIKPGTGDTLLLRHKLDAGGFSAVSLNSAEDLRDRADYLGLQLVQKHGPEEGLQRYGDLCTRVLSDAASAFEITKREDRKFGLEMLSELRNKFNQRRANNEPLQSCSNEHLEGFAYSLTSQCKIVWSMDRPWEVIK